MTDANADFSVWDTQEGFVADYEGTVQQALFTFRSDYNNGESLILELEFAVSPDVNEDGVRSEIYPVGKDWDQIDGGMGCQNAKGLVGGSEKRALFNNQSGCGMLATALKNAEGFDAVKMGTPYRAESYVGLSMQLESVEYTTKFQGEEKVRTRTLPVKVWRGTPGASAPVATAAAMTVAATPAPTTPDNGVAAAKAAARAATQAPPVGGVDLPGVAQARQIASEVPDHTSFVNRAYAEIGELAAENADLEALIDNPANWTYGS